MYLHPYSKSYSFFDISTPIMLVKGLEFIKCGICIRKRLLCEPTSCGQRSSPYKRNRQLLGFKNKRNHQRDSRNIRSGQINSLVHSEKKKHTDELSNIKRPGRPRRTTVVMIGEKPFHNIQPREEYSPGARRVYNQEKTSPEQTQRLIHHKLQIRPDSTLPKNI